MNFLAVFLILKFFYTLSKTPLGETGCLRLLKHPVFQLIFCNLRDTMPHQRSPLLFHCFVTLGSPYYPRDHYSHYLQTL